MAFNVKWFQSYSVNITSDYAQTYVYNAQGDSIQTIMAPGYFNDLVLRVRQGDRVFCTSTTNGMTFTGSFNNDSKNVSVDWDNVKFIEGLCDIINDSAKVYLSAPYAGVITKTYAVATNNITGYGQLYFFIGPDLSIPISNSNFLIINPVAGQYFYSIPTGNNVIDGTKAIQCLNLNGGSGTPATVRVGYKIICPSLTVYP